MTDRTDTGRWRSGAVAGASALTLLFAGSGAACAQARPARRPAVSRPAAPSAPAVAERTLKVCVAADAPPDVRAAAQAILAACGTQPLLKTFVGSSAAAPTALTDTAALAAAPMAERAYSHLVVVGMISDPLVQAAWQREARQTEPGTLYAFGFGYLSGDIGYIESDRSPFLHSSAIPTAPFETEVVTITGTTPAGVRAAAHAFLARGLVNGVVAGPGWKRAQHSLLERDPAAPEFALPPFLPASAGGADQPLIAITQAAEDEYRGVLADTGIEPVAIWRAKYYVPGAWDGAGAASAFANYANGLHRRAYGDTLWCARFPSPAAAATAAPKIAHAAGLQPQGKAALWLGKQPGYMQGNSPGPLTLWQRSEWVLMSTLPDAPTQALRTATQGE